VTGHAKTKAAKRLRDRNVVPSLNFLFYSNPPWGTGLNENGYLAKSLLSIRDADGM
jgi:hypothetical protein